MPKRYLPDRNKRSGLVREQRKNKKVYGIIFLLGLLWLTSCGKQETEEKTDTGFVAAVTGVFDSADTAVVAEDRKSVV